MLKKYLSVITAALLLNTFAFARAASADAKPDKQARLAEKVKEGISKLGVGKQSLVAVKLRDKTKLAGYVSEAGDEGFVVSNVKTGEATNVAYANVTQVQGHNLSTGAKIAIGIAIGVGVALIILAIFINCCTG